MNTFLLDLLAFGAILSGVLVITSKNPVISVLFLISVFINAAGYLMVLGVGFIGISYLIVYVGAIAILFLFVVMMLNISISTLTSVGAEYTKNIPLGFLVATLFTFEVMSLVPFGFETSLLNLFNQLNSLLLGMPLSSSGINIAYTDTTSDQSFVEYLQVEAIGQGLYTYGSLWLLLSSIILLLAMLGPIVLCHVSANKQSLT